MLALIAFIMSVSLPLASTTIEKEVEVSMRFIFNTDLGYQLIFRVKSFVATACEFLFQQFLSSNGFASVTMIENGTSFLASSIGSKTMRQILAGKNVFFRFVIFLELL